ncbi:MAG: TetR/AcrR family transcriptional regulator [Spirochaetales bacterium]|nr:TetR/AcrR family transcriptional regulator [Spirochaetales bacterium]
MENKERILETALKLFSLQSYEAVGIQQVAVKAEVSKPTIYHYFESKRGLLDKLMAYYGTPYFKALEEAARYKGDVKGTLTQVARIQLELAQKNEAYYRLYKSMSAMAAQSESHQAARPYVEREYRILEHLFQAIAADHGNIRGRYRVYAATFMGTLAVLVDLYANKIDYKDEDVHFRVIHSFMHGIFS